MSEKWTLAKVYEAFPGGIRVPRIQRGYVQGRDDAKGMEIRAEFVPVLVDAVFGGPALSLDFLYGVATEDGAEGQCLLPLDGQQRLTTLWLLAWLCGRDMTTWQFGFESRRIPQLFMKGLREHPRTGPGTPSEEITSSPWFLPVWKSNPGVVGMLRMLDALELAIGARNRITADFGKVTFLLHGISGQGATFDHIFRKMNARGKELSPWENLKAMLDKHVPGGFADEWRDKIDGDWAESLWGHVGRKVAALDNAMEKVVRMVYACFAGSGAQGDSLWAMESRLSGKVGDGGEMDGGFSPETREAFYRAAAQGFNALERVTGCWTDDRTTNALWGDQDDNSKFWEWLGNDRNASAKDILRFAFLAESEAASDGQRRKRALLNLLDASTSIDNSNFAKALEAGRAFLAGTIDVGGIAERKAGYSPEQLADEEKKWPIDESEIVSFETDDLVYQGSLRFIAWAPFIGADGIRERLERVHRAIEADWFGFYQTLASRLRLDEIPWGTRLHVPLHAGDIRTWREEVLPNRLFITAIQSWALAPDAEPEAPAWVRHLGDLLEEGRVCATTLRMLDAGWLFLLQNRDRRSGNSIRLDWNDHERANRQLLKAGDVFYATPWPFAEAKEEGVWYKVTDPTWWETDNPPQWGKEPDGGFAPLSAVVKPIETTT